MTPTPDPPKLLDQLRHALITGHYSPRTIEAYTHWVRAFVLFHHKRHPRDMGADEVREFLTDLAVNRSVSASTQNQALGAVLYLYRQVLHLEIGSLGDVPRGRLPNRLPVVLSRDEVRRVLHQLTGTSWLVVMLLYGAGLRLLEALELRVKDIDTDRRQIIVRRGKGQKDRAVLLPSQVLTPLGAHLEGVKQQHDADVANGFGRVVLQEALERKYPNAASSWSWQFVFPASRICRDPRFGPPIRFHLHETVIQRDVARAARAAGIGKRVGCHTFRHSFATHLLENVSTTMIYTHVLQKGALGVRSPADSL